MDVYRFSELNCCVTSAAGVCFIREMQGYAITVALTFLDVSAFCQKDASSRAGEEDKAAATAGLAIYLLLSISSLRSRSHGSFINQPTHNLDTFKA